MSSLTIQPSSLACCSAKPLAILTLLGSTALFAFSLYYWTEGGELDFWLSFSRLTSWALFLTFVCGFLTSLILLRQEGWFLGIPWGYWDVSFRVSAFKHLWPTVFAFNAVVLILFFSGATGEQLLSRGAIPAHLIFVACLFHAALYRIPVSPLCFFPSIVTGLLYLAVTGVYTLANSGQGPYYPNRILDWQTGVTAAAVFIGLAIILVFDFLLFFFALWRDTVRAPRPLTAAPPPPAAPSGTA